MGRQKSGISNQEIIIHGNGYRPSIESVKSEITGRFFETGFGNHSPSRMDEYHAFVDLGSAYGLRRGGYKQCNSEGCSGFCSVRGWSDYTSTHGHGPLRRYNTEEIHLSLPGNLEEFKKTYFALARLDGREPLDLSFDYRPGETTSEDMYAY